MKERSPTLSCFLLSYDDRPPSVQTTTFDRPNFSLSFSSKCLIVVVTDWIFFPKALLQVLKSTEALCVLGGRLTVFVAATLLNTIDGRLAH